MPGSITGTCKETQQQTAASGRTWSPLLALLYPRPEQQGFTKDMIRTPSTVTACPCRKSCASAFSSWARVLLPCQAVAWLFYSTTHQRRSGRKRMQCFTECSTASAYSLAQRKLIPWVVAQRLVSDVIGAARSPGRGMLLRPLAAIALSVILGGIPATTSAGPYSRIFVFGDSLSDTGNIFHCDR